MAKEVNREESDFDQVKITLPLIPGHGKYSRPLYVSVNNYSATIPRGIEVSVPRYIAEHIKETNEQIRKTDDLMKKLQT